MPAGVKTPYGIFCTGTSKVTSYKEFLAFINKDL